MNGSPSVKVALFKRYSGSESPCRWFCAVGIYTTTGMVVPFKTDLRLPIPGQQRHGGQIIHTYMPDFMNLLTSGVKKGEGG